MNKILTRRGQEYFEVLDSLYSKGYVTNERWHLLNIKEQENTPRMTSRVIEDALLEHGYSKGSPTEQKRYRLLWMKERGMASGLIGENKEDQIKNLESDPVFSAVTALRKQLRDEANLVIEEATKKAEQKVTEINTKNSELETKLYNLQDKYNEFTVIHNELKNKANKLGNDLLEAIKEKTHFETTLKAEQANFLKDKSQFETDLKDLRNKYDNLYKDKTKEIEDLHTKYKEEVSLIKEYSERQRHDHIAEIENLKVANNKLDKQVEKITLLEQKANNTNTELKQRIKTLEGELDFSSKIHSDLTRKFHASETALAETKGELKQLQISLNEYKNNFQENQKQLLDYKEKVGRLEEQLQQARLELAKREKGKAIKVEKQIN